MKKHSMCSPMSVAISGITSAGNPGVAALTQATLASESVR